MKTRWAIARFSAILAVLIVATPSTAQKTAGRIFDIAVRDSVGSALHVHTRQS